MTKTIRLERTPSTYIRSYIWYLPNEASNPFEMDTKRIRNTTIDGYQNGLTSDPLSGLVVYNGITYDNDLIEHECWCATKERPKVE